jgi:hypothetical protein
VRTKQFRKGSLQDQRISRCKICAWGIFTSQRREWSANPVGLIHTDCKTRPEGDGDADVA